MKPSPDFLAKITVTRGRKTEPNLSCFVFGEDGQRRVPMELEGTEGLHTVNIWVGRAAIFPKGESFEAELTCLDRTVFEEEVCSGTKFMLWDGGFFAEGHITRDLGRRINAADI